MHSEAPPSNDRIRSATPFSGARACALVAVALTLVSSCSSRRDPPASEPPANAVVPGAADAGTPTAEPLLDTGTTIAGEAIDYPSSALPQVVAQIVTIAPGQVTGWHRHGVPTFGYLLSGRLDIEYAGLGRRILGAGDRLMEAMQTAHNAANLGTEPVRILVVFMGAQGKPTVMKADPPAMPEELGNGRSIELVELADLDPRLELDLRYATANNFTGGVVYPSAHAFLQRPAAEALSRANARANAEGYGLLVLDAYRPWSVTRMFWDSFPMHRAYLADPLQGSRHNRGCALDLTLVELSTGAEVKMPSAYDDFSERAHPHYEGGTSEERTARDLLREIMEAEGFTVYENEWWHFDYQGWREYPVLDLTFEAAAAGR
jgi:D-alanyl-D-alanine dipeptidase